MKNDLSGMMFGRILVLSFFKEEYGERFWKCKCSCGNEFIGREIDFAYMGVKSCGCRKPCLPKGVSSSNNIFADYKRRAEKKGMEFSISKEFFLKTIASDCYYCGAAPSNKRGSGGSMNGEFVYNGIDRKNNLVGYTPDNVVPCCKICNTAKNTLSVAEFEEWIWRVSSRISLRQLFEKDENKTINLISKG